ncbi:MAG: FtsX-like permease family protein, partial [Clostridia bacterium]
VINGIYDDLDVLGEPIIVMNTYDFDEFLNQIYLPKNVLVNANLSGDGLMSAISELHADGYEVSCRNEQSLKTIGDIMIQFTQVFFLASGVLAFFVTLLLFNFISASIANKKKEIGILRAIGARGVDVMKIFVFEGIMLAIIIIAFSVPLVAIGSRLVNAYMLSVLPVVLVSFSFKQVISIGALTLFIILLSSFLPVWSISKKKPIDAIKDK